MYDHQLFVRTLSEFTHVLLTEYDSDVVLAELVGRASEVLGLAGSGVSLAEGDRLAFDIAHGDGVAELERIQEVAQAGPCVTAFRSGEIVTVEDLTGYADRWPDYCRTAAALGIVSVASLPMRLGDRSVGAVNLYADGSRDWSEEDLSAAAVMADMATAYLINASQHRQQVELNQQLQLALDSRVVIEQAKGMLAARHQLTPEEAFDRLRGHARSHHASVRDVADAIVRLGLEL